MVCTLTEIRLGVTSLRSSTRNPFLRLSRIDPSRDPNPRIASTRTVGAADPWVVDILVRGVL